MPTTKPRVLTINSGSSSIKFALFLVDQDLDVELYGKIDRIGLFGTVLTFNYLQKQEQGRLYLEVADHKLASYFLLDWLAKHLEFDSINAIGHRVVHGMRQAGSQVINQCLLGELKNIAQYDPDHLPSEIALIEGFSHRYPHLTQVACFDTTFHHHMPRIAKLIAIPRRYEKMGVQRYGFHGISYEYLMEELVSINDEAKISRVILAHLGSGASMAAILNGKSIDTSMGFSPTSGLPMGTRSGDIDPGLVSYLVRTENMSDAQFHHMTNHESGLIGISEISGDLRDLLNMEGSDSRAEEAVSFFCYQAKKQIGAYAAALGGLDAIVFSGGIGENSPAIRQRICDGLDYLGITLDQDLNAKNATCISLKTARVKVRVIPTNEELMIARSVSRILDLKPMPPSHDS